MTLAIILLLGFSGVAPAHSVQAQSATQSTAASQSTNDAAPKSQQNGQDASTPPSPQTPSPQKASPHKPTVKRTRHKKKPAGVDCATPKPTAAATPDSQAAGAESGDATAAKASSTPAPPTNCPPSKIVVRQGGTSEPSIQLAGGDSGDRAARDRDTANQMLRLTQQNLNKLAGRQLDENQKNMQNQVHQFMDQAKSAVDAGDLDRARTLAWKAQLLSEELVNPQQ